MIDFNKIGTGTTVDTLLKPREIFNALPLKNEKYKYPRDVQSQVWSKWYERRNEKDLILKMNTGSGKTVVGLLILKSCLNEKKGPAVYVCPDNYLVKQVLDSSLELGIETTEDMDSQGFLSGKSILVINIHKLVNGKSKFGTIDEGIKQSIGSLVIDDAHACIGSVEDQFTIKIPDTSDLYKDLFDLFKESLFEQCEPKAKEIELGEPRKYMQLPYWTWHDQISNVNDILVRNQSEKFLKYKWPLIKHNLKYCHCVISSGEIEISTHMIPIHVIPSLQDAKRKIFMTATLVDDSVLISHFEVNEENIKNTIIPDSAGDIGDRMILMPQSINPDITDDVLKDYCKKIANKINVVVIVPSYYRSKYWEDSADLILNKNSLDEGIKNLKESHVGLVVLINQYDGIDLPGRACRLLVIDGLPDVRKLIDQVKHNIISNSPQQISQTIQKIEQGMGRGIRSNDDYCVVFLIGKNLNRQLYSQGAINRFSPGTKAQFDLSEQVAEQIRNKPIKELTNVIKYCLIRDENWVKTSKGVLASLEYNTGNQIDPIIVSLRKAYDLAIINNYTGASAEISNIVNITEDIKIKGYLKQHLAEYINIYDKVEAQKTQMSASSENRNVLKPIDGIQYHKLKRKAQDQAISCKNFLTRKFSDPNKLIIEIKGINELLVFKEGTSNAFEQSIKDIAKYIGFGSQRPEQEYKKGPDNLWEIGNLNYLVIECKNGATSDFINKKDCNQLNGSGIWFEEKYDSTCSYTPIMIHPSNIFEYASSPKNTTRIMTEEKLEEFLLSITSFIKSISVNNEYTDENSIKEKLLIYKLRAEDIVNVYTVPYKIR